MMGGKCSEYADLIAAKSNLEERNRCTEYTLNLRKGPAAVATQSLQPAVSN